MNQSGMNELDRVEILTLQDNYTDMTATDNGEMIRRAGMRAAGEQRKSVLAEHGSRRWSERPSAKRQGRCSSISASPISARRLTPAPSVCRWFAPRYIVPTHCTGGKSIQEIEAAMPGSFLLNMSGTRLTSVA